MALLEEFGPIWRAIHAAGSFTFLFGPATGAVFALKASAIAIAKAEMVKSKAMHELPDGDIGFIGLGAMGKPMVSRLAAHLGQGQKIYVYDVVQSAMDDVCASFSNQIQQAGSPKEVGDKCATILTMVPEGSHVRTVYLDEKNGLLTAPLDRRLLIDCSTIDVETSQTINAAIGSVATTASFYDAPVSGGVVGAERGTLAFFLGCSEADPQLPTLQQLLGTMGGSIIPCGSPTLGIAAKLSNNYLSGLLAIIVSESFSMGMSAGLNPLTLYKVFAAGTAQNTITDRFCPVPGIVKEAPSSRDYQGGFKLQLMKKDVGLALAMAEKGNVELHFGRIGLDIYQAACQDKRCIDRDSRVVYRFLGGKEDWEGRAENEKQWRGE